MSRLLFFIYLFVSMVLSVTCSTKRNYQLRDANQSLKQFERTELNPLQLSPYSHSVFGLPEYDHYLEECYRTIIQVRFAETAVIKTEEHLTKDGTAGEFTDAYAFAYRELPLFKLKLDKLHFEGLELLAQTSMESETLSPETALLLRNEITFSLEEIQYLRIHIKQFVDRSNHIYAKVFDSTPTQNRISATKLPLHNPHKGTPLFLGNSDDTCYATREYRQWFALWGMVRISSLSLEEMFPDPNQSYRFEEKVTAFDGLSLLFLVSPISTLTTKTIRIDACDSPLLAEYRATLGERDLYRTLIAKTKEEENPVVSDSGTNREVGPINKTVTLKKVAIVQLTSGILLQGDIQGFTEDTVRLESDTGIVNIEKSQIDRIRYTRIEVDENGRPI